MQNKIFLKTHISWFFEDSNKQTKLWERKREKQNQTILEMESVRQLQVHRNFKDISKRSVRNELLIGELCLSTSEERYEEKESCVFRH